VHGSQAVVSAILSSLGNLEGFSMAKPGEFTRRAFENGKMDLTEVEGLSDLLKATTDVERTNALHHLKGDLRKLYSGWMEQLMSALALYEAIIDFGDDDDIPEYVLSQGKYIFDDHFYFQIFSQRKY
jgi:tRNA modification GTPase